MDLNLEKSRFFYVKKLDFKKYLCYNSGVKKGDIYEKFKN